RHSLNYNRLEPLLLDWLSAAGGRLVELQPDQDDHAETVRAAEAEHAEALRRLDNLLETAAAGREKPAALLAWINDAQTKFDQSRLKLEAVKSTKPEDRSPPPQKNLHTVPGRER